MKKFFYRDGGDDPVAKAAGAASGFILSLCAGCLAGFLFVGSVPSSRVAVSLPKTAAVVPSVVSVK